MTRLLTSGVGLGVVTSAALSVWILAGLGGWAYYGTPIAVRGYAARHAVLRPSGPAGQTFGVVGTAMMLMPFLYMLRKRFKSGRLGSMKAWLEGGAAAICSVMLLGTRYGNMLMPSPTYDRPNTASVSTKGASS